MCLHWVGKGAGCVCVGVGQGGGGGGGGAAWVQWVCLRAENCTTSKQSIVIIIMEAWRRRLKDQWPLPREVYGEGLHCGLSPGRWMARGSTLFSPQGGLWWDIPQWPLPGEVYGERFHSVLSPGRCMVRGSTVASPQGGVWWEVPLCSLPREVCGERFHSVLSPGRCMVRGSTVASPQGGVWGEVPLCSLPREVYGERFHSVSICVTVFQAWRRHSRLWGCAEAEQRHRLRPRQPGAHLHDQAPQSPQVRWVLGTDFACWSFLLTGPHDAPSAWFGLWPHRSHRSMGHFYFMSVHIEAILEPKKRRKKRAHIIVLY